VLYKKIFRLVFSKMDPETAHHIGMLAIRILGFLGLARLAKIGTNPQKVNAMGLTFDGPFGIAAGFDKNAVAVKALGDLGFSHVEIGTVTAIPQPGNPKPRLFRLIKDRALINRMGFNNDGAVVVARRIADLRKRHGDKLPVIGVNIGKSKVVDIENALGDYETSARLLGPVSDYLAVNVSSPNTPGLRSLQAIEQLEPILVAVKRQVPKKPVLVKIAPDLNDADVVDIANLVNKLDLAGVIATNTTISRQGLQASSSEVEAMGLGGLSGPILKKRSLEVLDILSKNLSSSKTIISVGGVETKEDVAERIKAGATLVQGYTGFVYFGPLWARKINS
jgi:dihydroorotate dehydrogenase